jgi:hypothetical protein
MRIEEMKRQAQNLIAQAYQLGYQEGREDALTVDSDKYREQGRNEAWEAARKLVSMGYKECNEVLGDGILTIETNDEIFTRFTASEAIDKLRKYEEQKKQEEDSEIHVGDEVMYHEDKGIVIREINTNICICMMMGYDGSYTMKAYKHELVKTGRTFHEIAEVMKKMREDE